MAQDKTEGRIKDLKAFCDAHEDRFFTITYSSGFNSDDGSLYCTWDVTVFLELEMLLKIKHRKGDTWITRSSRKNLSRALGDMLRHLGLNQTPVVCVIDITARDSKETIDPLKPQLTGQLIV